MSSARGEVGTVLLALFGQMERTYAVERASHVRSVDTAKGRRVGRPSVVTDAQLAYATQLRDGGATIAEIVTKTGLNRSTVYRHLPPRPGRSPPRLRNWTRPAPHQRSPRPGRGLVIRWCARPVGTGPPRGARRFRIAKTWPPSGCIFMGEAGSASNIIAPAANHTGASWWSAAADAATAPWSPTPTRPVTNHHNRSWHGLMTTAGPRPRNSSATTTTCDPPPQFRVRRDYWLLIEQGFQSGLCV